MRNLWLVAVLSLVPTVSFAFELPAKLHLDAAASWGISKPAVDTAGERPTFTHWGVGVTAAYRFSERAFAGFTSDFRSAGQYSDILSTVGAISGHRWNAFAPTLGWRGVSGFTFKADFQFVGTYSLRVGGDVVEELGYENPLGGRIIATYPMSEHVYAGGQYELVTFGRKVSNLSGVEELDSRRAFWQLGLIAGYLF